jgi:tetratricopeptide (TPR) repeat protein
MLIYIYALLSALSLRAASEAAVASGPIASAAVADSLVSASDSLRAPAAAAPVDTLSFCGDLYAKWDAANTEYVNGNYAGAIVRYDSIVAVGRESYKLYYNLGNAHFKAGHIGLSILNYRRALRLAPSNGDVKYNLAIANSYVKDNIETVPEFFVVKWLRGVRQLLDGNGWACISIVALAVALFLALIYLLASNMLRRKIGFYGAIAMLVMFITSALFASVDRREDVESSSAVIIDRAIPVKSSPGDTSKDIFVIHEGAAVEILDRLGDWREISIADGNKGWVKAAAIAAI